MLRLEDKKVRLDTLADYYKDKDEGSVLKNYVLNLWEKVNQKKGIILEEELWAALPFILKDEKNDLFLILKNDKEIAQSIFRLMTYESKKDDQTEPRLKEIRSAAKESLLKSLGEDEKFSDLLFELYFIKDSYKSKLQEMNSDFLDNFKKIICKNPIIAQAVLSDKKIPPLTFTKNEFYQLLTISDSIDVLEYIWQNDKNNILEIFNYAANSKNDEDPGFEMGKLKTTFQPENAAIDKVRKMFFSEHKTKDLSHWLSSHPDAFFALAGETEEAMEKNIPKLLELSNDPKEFIKTLCNHLNRKTGNSKLKEMARIILSKKEGQDLLQLPNEPNKDKEIEPKEPTEVKKSDLEIKCQEAIEYANEPIKQGSSKLKFVINDINKQQESNIDLVKTENTDVGILKLIVQQNELEEQLRKTFKKREQIWGEINLTVRSKGIHDMFDDNVKMVDPDIKMVDPDVMIYFFLRSIQEAKRSSLGNCQELADLALEYFLKTGTRAQRYQIKGADHTFIVVNAKRGSDVNNPDSWGDEAYICDPWVKKVYKASEFKSKFKEIMLEDYDKSKHIPAPIPFFDTDYLQSEFNDEYLAGMSYKYWWKANEIKNAIEMFIIDLMVIQKYLKDKYTENHEKYAVITTRINEAKQFLNKNEKLFEKLKLEGDVSYDAFFQFRDKLEENLLTLIDGVWKLSKFKEDTIALTTYANEKALSTRIMKLFHKPPQTVTMLNSALKNLTLNMEGLKSGETNKERKIKYEQIKNELTNYEKQESTFQAESAKKNG